MYANLVYRYPWSCLCNNGIWKMNELISNQYSNRLRSRLQFEAPVAPEVAVVEKAVAALGVLDVPLTVG